MDTTLEGVAPKEEVAKATQKEEQKPTPLKAEPTIKIQDTEEFKKALDRAVSKGLANYSHQLVELKASNDKTERDSKNFEVALKATQDELDQLAQQKFEDDPVARKVYLDNKVAAEDKRQAKVERETAEIEREENKKDAWKLQMNRKADEVAKETGIPIEELKDAQTLEELDVRGLKYQLAAKEAPELEQKFDSGISSASGGTGWTNEKVKALPRTPKGFKEFNDNLPAILQAAREGKIT